LHGLAHGTWTRGDLPAAKCERSALNLPHHPEDGPVPSLSCSCGWHAYKTIDALRANSDDPRLRRPSDVWVGAVVGWGRIAPHVDGWRAERARLVALMGAAHLGGEAVAEAFGVPLFRFDYPVGGDVNGSELGATVGTAYGAGVIVGASTLHGLNYVRVAMNGHVRRFRDTDLQKVELMPDVTDGATRMFHGSTFEESWGKASTALAEFAKQFGTPLDEVDARYRVETKSVPINADTQAAYTVSFFGAGFAPRQSQKQIAKVFNVPTQMIAKTITRKKLYDRKWRDAKRAGAMLKFKGDWAAGLVTDTWRP
jgi:hypothetical protein